jgi:hypothetical protein
MNAILRTTVTAAAVALLAGSAVAADGALIVMKVTSGANPPQTIQMQLEQKRMRTDVTGPTGATAAIVFDGTRQVMTMIDDARKSYTELTKADLDAFAKQLSGAMAQVAQMEQMMKTLPPEQRKKFEEMTKGRSGAGMPGAAPAKVEYKKVGTGTVGKWTCDKYEGYTNGQKTHELCTVDPKVLGFAMTDFEVTRDMAEFYKQFQQFGGAAMAAQQPLALGKLEQQGFSGFPVRSVVTTGGSQVTQEMTEAKRQAFPDSTFQVPAGYQKHDLLGSPGRRGR